MALEPTDAISVAQARDWANALSSHEAESVVEQIIRSAFSRTEAALNRAILTQTRRTVTSQPPDVLYIEPFTSLTVTRVSASDTETDVTDSYRAIPESGRVEALARVQADRGDTFRFDYVCGWAADAIPAEVREQILGTIGYIARFRGETTTNDQFIKRVPLCHSSYRRATMQSPSWIIMTGAVVA